MKRVLVLDACQRSALAVTRSLGKHGVSMVTADESASALAGSSRYSKKYISYPSPRLHPDKFVSTVARICKQENISIVIPMTELTTNLLLNHQDQLHGITLPFAEAGVVDALADDLNTWEAMERLNELLATDDRATLLASAKLIGIDLSKVRESDWGKPFHFETPDGQFLEEGINYQPTVGVFGWGNISDRLRDASLQVVRR